MSRLPRGPFLGALSLTLALALTVMAGLAYVGSGGPGPRQASPRQQVLNDRVDTDALIAADQQARGSGPDRTAGQPNTGSRSSDVGQEGATAPASAEGAGLPAHGPLLFDVSSVLPDSAGQLGARVGNGQRDKVRVLDQAIEFDVSTASRAMISLPPNVQPSSFVAVMKVDLVSGAGAFTFSFHMNQEGDQQHAVQLYTDGTTEAALFDGPGGTRSLFRPLNPAPALNRSAVLAIAVDGPSMRIFVNGVEVGTAHDGTLTEGGMGFKAGAAAREDPFVMRLTELRVYQPANAA
jgi:hypothetical protein